MISRVWCCKRRPGHVREAPVSTRERRVIAEPVDLRCVYCIDRGQYLICVHSITQILRGAVMHLGANTITRYAHHYLTWVGRPVGYQEK